LTASPPFILLLSSSITFPLPSFLFFPSQEKLMKDERKKRREANITQNSPLGTKHKLTNLQEPEPKEPPEKKQEYQHSL
jgi:hypothetical protein